MIYLGLIGMLLILTAFLLEEFSQKLTRDTIHYNLLNLLGSGLLIYYAFALNSIPFIILNAVWFIAASVKMFTLK